MFVIKSKQGRYLARTGINPIWTDLIYGAKKFRQFDAEKTQSFLKEMLGIETELEPLYWQDDPVLQPAKCFADSIGHFDSTL